METAKTLFILRCLAQGVDPETGEALIPTHLYQRPDTIRALFAAVQTLEAAQRLEATHKLEAAQRSSWGQNPEWLEAASALSSGVPAGQSFRPASSPSSDDPSSLGLPPEPDESAIPEGVYVFRKMALSS